MQVDLIGMRSEVILVARKRVARSDDRLAAELECVERRGELLELAQAAAGKSIESQIDAFDALVFGRELDGIEQITHQRLGLRAAALNLGERSIERIARELVDKDALRRNDERGRLRHEHALRCHDRQQDGDDREQENQVQEAAQVIERTPSTANPSEQPELTSHRSSNSRYTLGQ